MDYKQKSKKETLFKKWFLDNRFSIVLLNILLFFLIIWIFKKISFVLNPAWVFFSAILPPLLLAVIQYYVMNPVVDWFEKKFKVPRVATILVLFLFVLISSSSLILSEDNIKKSSFSNTFRWERRILVSTNFVIGDAPFLLKFCL